MKSESTPRPDAASFSVSIDPFLLCNDRMSRSNHIFWWQDIAAAIDEEDVAKFTDAVKDFDSMTPLVHLSL